jgi:hypothetical protein
VKLKGVARGGWYVPKVGDNRAREKRGEPHLRVRLRGKSAGEYRATISVAVSAALAGASNREADVEEQSANDMLLAECVLEVSGLTYENDGDAAVKIGDREIKPSESLDVKTSGELLGVLQLAGEVETAIAIRNDLLEAIRSRSHLEAGLVPT